MTTRRIRKKTNTKKNRTRMGGTNSSSRKRKSSDNPRSPRSDSLKVESNSSKMDIETDPAKHSSPMDISKSISSISSSKTNDSKASKKDTVGNISSVSEVTEKDSLAYSSELEDIDERGLVQIKDFIYNDKKYRALELSNGGIILVGEQVALSYSTGWGDPNIAKKIMQGVAEAVDVRFISKDGLRFTRGKLVAKCVDGIHNCAVAEDYKTGEYAPINVEQLEYIYLPKFTKKETKQYVKFLKAFEKHKEKQREEQRKLEILEASIKRTKKNQSTEEQKQSRKREEEIRANVKERNRIRIISESKKLPKSEQVELRPEIKAIKKRKINERDEQVLIFNKILENVRKDNDTKKRKLSPHQKKIQPEKKLRSSSV